MLPAVNDRNVPAKHARALRPCKRAPALLWSPPPLGHATRRLGKSR